MAERDFSMHRKCGGYRATQCSPCSILSRVDPVRANLSMTMSWVRHCRDSHNRKECAAEEDEHRPSLPSDLMLIDYHDMQVIRCEKCMPYCSFSYTWGSQYRDIRPTEFTKGILPPAIKDALEATKMLGHRYLWVDQYCVPQDNPTERHRQISMIDSIYAGAALTLVAAAGNGAHCGLPGMGTVSRRRIGVFHNGYTILIQRHESGEPEFSEWGSRGWSFQEEVLFHRVLYFGPDQLIFRCATTRTPVGGKDIRYRECSGPDGLAIEPFARDRHPHHNVQGLSLRDGSFNTLFFDVVQQYQQRKFTFESDAELGLLGILRKLAIEQDMVFLQSIPLSVDGARYQERLPPASTSMLCHWMLYAAPWKTRRRHEFPSWSWLGWHLVEQVSGRDAVATLPQQLESPHFPTLCRTFSAKWRHTTLVPAHSLSEVEARTETKHQPQTIIPGSQIPEIPRAPSHISQS